MNNAIESLKRNISSAIVLFVFAALAGGANVAAFAQGAPAHQHKNKSQASPAPAVTASTDPAVARAAAEAAAAKLKAPANAGDFYIVSSINMGQKQIVLKLPTEVTLLVQTNDQSQYLDEQGKPLTLKDLRAGDTVFVLLLKTATGAPIVQRLQRGGMTVQELHKKYMAGS